jgi:transposase InsO family protein
MNKIHPLALFRLSVLGPLASRSALRRGELKQLLGELAAREYDMPGSGKTRLSEKTLQAWYYAWRAGGIEALAPQARADKGQSKISAELQVALMDAKREQPQRSLRQLQQLMEQAGLAARGELSRASIHRLLQRHGLSRPPPGGGAPVERRSFVAARAGELWYGDVMHGPNVAIDGRWRKSYLISLMDDASRLIAHSAFCASETALAVEGVLKQALLKRGVPVKLVVDNGSAYRAASLQGICARLQIRLIYCRPYQPEGKGKLERWHRVVRAGFLSELSAAHCQSLSELNARLWAWLEQVYHQSAHSALGGLTPWARWTQDLVHIRPLGALAEHLDALFYHRHVRAVRKDGTVSFQGRRFEVDYQLSSRSVVVVVDPHRAQVIAVENRDGERLGLATPLDAHANIDRPRVRPRPGEEAPAPARRFNAVEQAYQAYAGPLAGPAPDEEDDT